MMRTALFRPALGLAALLAAAAAPAGAVTIDNFESLDNWITFADEAGSTITISTIPGVSGNALNMHYDLTAGNYAGMFNATLGGLNLTTLGANALRFSYRAFPSTHTIEVKIADSDGIDSGRSDKLVYKKPAKDEDRWYTEVVPFADLDLYPDGDGSFDMTQVAFLSFGTTRDSGVPGTGTIRFDNISLYRLDGPVPLVNDYEDSAPSDDCWVANSCLNDRTTGLDSRFFASANPFPVPLVGYSMIVSTQAAPGGGGSSREITFDTTNGSFLGLYEKLEGVSVVGTDILEFYAKGAVGAEPLRVQVKSTGMVFPFPTISLTVGSSWQKYSIPFSDFKVLVPALNLDSLNEIVFLIETAGAGKVYFDSVNLVRTGAASGIVKTLEDFTGAKLILGYGEYASIPGATLTMDFEKDPSSPEFGIDPWVGRLDYSFDASSPTPYAVVERPLGLNLLAEQTLNFRFKGTGANSDLEIKLADADGTVYRKVVPDASNTGGVWKTASIPVDNFSFFALGADANLKLTRISKVEFVAARGQAMAGDLAFDLMESTASRAFDTGAVGSVLTSLGTPDNPFSPNGDGLKDVFKVEYTLFQLARVVMKVYSLQGVPVKTIDAGDQLAGSHVLTWDGVADNGRLVANGLYMYVIEAKGASAGTDTLKQIVAVMR